MLTKIATTALVAVGLFAALRVGARRVEEETAGGIRV